MAFRIWQMVCAKTGGCKLMVEKYILINTMKKMIDFNQKLQNSRADIDFVSGQFVIDAKSIMGIMALDISHPIKMQITGFDEDIKKILEEIEPYIVKK